MKPWYVVWKIGSGPPTVRHSSIEKAKNEAKRLAKEFPGETVVVLVADSAFCYNKTIEVNYFNDLNDFDPVKLPFVSYYDTGCE